MTTEPIPAGGSRQREIDQGLRTETGELIGGLHVLDYVQGIRDYEDGVLAPRVSSTSYDLGRFRAAEKAELRQAVLDQVEQRFRAADEAIREMLADQPDLLAEYEASMARLRKPPPPPMAT